MSGEVPRKGASVRREVGSSLTLWRDCLGQMVRGSEEMKWLDGAVEQWPGWNRSVLPPPCPEGGGSGARHASHCRGRQGATCGGLLEAAQCCGEEHRLPNQLFVTLQPVT